MKLIAAGSAPSARRKHGQRQQARHEGGPLTGDAAAGAAAGTGRDFGRCSAQPRRQVEDQPAAMRCAARCGRPRAARLQQRCPCTASRSAGQVVRRSTQNWGGPPENRGDPPQRSVPTHMERAGRLSPAGHGRRTTSRQPVVGGVVGGERIGPAKSLIFLGMWRRRWLSNSKAGHPNNPRQFTSIPAHMVPTDDRRPHGVHHEDLSFVGPDDGGRDAEEGRRGCSSRGAQDGEPDGIPCCRRGTGAAPAG